MKRALIVEDDPAWADILVACAKQADFESIVVNSPQLAMDAMDIEIPDVVVLDMLLAVETGVALLNEMRGYPDLAKIPVIVCSSVEGLNMDNMKAFGVKYVFDKSIMNPVDIRYALRSLAHE